MLKTVIVLPDGTELSSGGHAINAIQSVTLTECVNSDEELTLGSTCANALEATLFTPEGGLAIAAGAEVTVHKEDPTGSRKQVGVFVLEKPTRPSANTMKLTGYDRVSKLDKDLTAWLSGLAEWPYTLIAFAGMVCEACGLTFKQTEVPNGDFSVQQFTRSSVTGRQIMRWLGEICARLCRASADGEIEFAWYVDSGKTITATGDPYYFQNGLTYEDFSTAPIDTVQLRLADSEDGALWPAADEGANSYIITGNPILNARISSDLETTLGAIKAELAGVTYTPCKVEIPANMDIRAGNTVKITDKNGKTVTAYVMTKTQTGQKDTLECTGNHRRDASSTVNNQSASSTASNAANQAASDAKKYADSLDTALDQMEVLKRLTVNNTDDAIYLKDGKLVIDATAIRSGVLESSVINGATLNITGGSRIANFHISGGYLYNGIDIGNANSCGIGCGSALGGSDDWIFWAGNGAFRVTLGGELHTTNLIASGGWIAGWAIDEYGLWSDDKTGIGLFTTYPTSASIAGSESKSDWRIVGGNKFGVDKEGHLYCSDGYFSGTVNATSGGIGGWHISEHGLSSGKWQNETNITEDSDVIDISKDYLQHVYFSAQEGTASYKRVEWDWIIDCAYAWAEAKSLT